jgi:hypothetical protein
MRDSAFVSELRRKYVLRPDDLVFQDDRNTVLFIRNGGKKLFRATREDGRVKLVGIIQYVCEAT